MPKIFIDPGHSISDPGAVGYEVERDLNEKVSEFMNEHLLANYVCETKVDPVTNKSLPGVAEAANAWGADLLVSNHFNAGGGDGYEALVYSEKTVPLGEVFEKHVKAIGQNSRGVKLRPGLAVLRQSNMPAVLNEGAFVDNKKDIEDWNDDAELKKLGIAYAEACAEWLKLEKKTPAVSEPEDDVIYRVQVGAFSNYEYAKSMQATLKAAGFEGYIVKGTM
jgi:N-acetylmuramoyl-L-alanine amidase